MDLTQALKPISIAELKDKWFGKKSLAIVRKSNPFEGLLSLSELETRINDGCASLTNLSVIDERGHKLPRAEIYTEQRPGGWSPSFLHKDKVRALLEQGSSFVLHNMSQINRPISELVASIEQNFPGFQCDLHIYASPRAGATGYQVHRDYPQHKIYLQLMGCTQWTVYKGAHEARSMSLEQAEAQLAVDFETKLLPGSVLYMPPNTFHRATNPDGPRISLSFPFHHHPGAYRVDRSHIPLQSLFTN